MCFHKAQCAEDCLAGDDNFLQELIFPNQSNFHCDGYKQNFHIWCSENQHVIMEEPMQFQLETALCGMWTGGIIAPFGLEIAERPAIHSHYFPIEYL